MSLKDYAVGVMVGMVGMSLLSSYFDDLADEKAFEVLNNADKTALFTYSQQSADGEPQGTIKSRIPFEKGLWEQFNKEVDDQGPEDALDYIDYETGEKKALVAGDDGAIATFKVTPKP